MESISNFFLSKLELINLTKFDRSGKQSAWRVINTSKKGASKVVEYFCNFPLFSSKYLDFLSWKEAQNILENKLHHKNKNLITDGSDSAENSINRIKELKSQINSKRTEFNWNHLNNFYLR